MWVLNMKTTASCFRQLSTAIAWVWGIQGWTVQPEKKLRRKWTSHRSLFSSFSPRQTQARNLPRYQGLRQMICLTIASTLVLSRELGGKHNWIKTSAVRVPAQTSPRAWSRSSNGAVLVQHTFPETAERSGMQVRGHNSFSTARKYRGEYSVLEKADLIAGKHCILCQALSRRVAVHTMCKNLPV